MTTEPKPSPPLPPDLVGYQQVMEGKVEEGDLLVRNGLERMLWATNLIGEPVSFGTTPANGMFRVYRRIPLPKQGEAR